MQRNWFSDWYLRLLFWILMECHCDNIYLQIHFGVIFTIVCTYKKMHFQLISVESWMRVDARLMYAFGILCEYFWFLFYDLNRDFFQLDKLNRLLFFWFLHEKVLVHVK